MPVPIVGVLVLVAAVWTGVASDMSDTVVYSQYTLLPDQIDSQVAGVTRSCMCRSLCAERNCTTYVVTEVDESNFLCQFSSSPVPLEDLQPQLPGGPRSFVVHKSDFKHIGTDYYKLLSPNTLTKQGPATLACKSVGGMLPMAHTPELLAQLVEAMRIEGIRMIWLALIRNYAAGSTTTFTAPMWNFSNGTSVEEPAAQIQSSTNRCYVLDLDEPAATRFNNIRSCAGPAAFICQRSF